MKYRRLCTIFFSLLYLNSRISGSEDPFADTPTQDNTIATSPSQPTQSAQPQTEPEEVSMDMDLPVIGTVQMYPFTQDGQSGFKVYVPKKGAQLNWGPLTIGQGTLLLIDNKPQYSAKATFFAQSATLALKDFSLDSSSTDKEKKYAMVRLNIQFDQNNLPTLELIPGKKANIQSVDVVLEKSKPIKMIAKSTLLGQAANITFMYDKGTTNAVMKMKSVQLKDIIPPVQNSPLENTQLQSLTVQVNNLSSTANQPKELIIQGIADLSKTLGLEDSKEAKQALLNIQITQQSQIIQANIEQLVLPAIGIIKDVKIKGIFTAAKKEVTLQGTANITLGNAGAFTVKVDSKITNAGLEFAGTVQQTVTFAGLDIQDAQVKFSTKEKTLYVSGNVKIKGYDAKIEIAYAAGTEAAKENSNMISASAKLSEKELRPFQEVPIPQVRNITLQNPVFKFVSKGIDIEIIMEGLATLFGIPLQGKLYLKKSDNTQTTLLEVAAPKDWKLSQGIPEFKGTIYDNIELQDLYFIISSNDYNDSQRQIKFRQGFNILAKTKLTGALVPIGQLTGTSPESLISLQGYLAPNPLDSVFKASIPTGITMKQDNVTVGSLALEISGSPTPAFSLLTNMIIKPSAADDPLTFSTRIKFQPPTFSFSGTLAGVWKNPLGIHGFTIGTDVPSVPVKGIAADIEVDLPKFVASHVPSSIGLAGSMMINPDKKVTMTDAHGKTIQVPVFVAMAIKLPIGGAADLVLYGELSQLTLEDLAVLAKNVVGSPLPVAKMPEIGMRNTKIYMVPKETTIGEFKFDRGFTMRGEMFVPGFKAYSNYTISQDGIIAQSMCSEIKWGPFLQLLRSAKETKEMKDKVELRDPKLAEYTGPVASLKLTLKDQSLYISGLMKILDLIEQDTIVSMDKDGILFDFEAAVGKSMYKDPKTNQNAPLLDAHVKGKSSGSLTEPQFELSVDFLDHFQAYLLSEIKEGIKNAKIQVTLDIATAIGKVQATKALNPSEVAKKVEDAQKQVNDQQPKIKELQKDIDDLQSKINQCV